MGKSKGIEKGAIPPPRTLEGGCVIGPRWAAGAPGAAHRLPQGGPTAVAGRQRACGWAGGRSVVELALARLVDEAALVLGPPRVALAGAVLPLHHLGAQRVALRPLPGALQPPRRARPLLQRGPRRRGGGCVRRRAGLAADGRRLPAGTERGRSGPDRPRGAKASPTLPTGSPHPRAGAALSPLSRGRPTPSGGNQPSLPASLGKPPWF